MADDPIAQNEHDALTRRMEAVEDRVESLQVQTGGNFAAIIEGHAALRREVRDGFAKVDARFNSLDQKMDGFIEEQRRTNAILVELLSKQVGKSADPAG